MFALTKCSAAWLLSGFCLLLFFQNPLLAASSSTMVYYAGQPRQDYYVDLMQQALSYRCAGDYQLAASRLDLPKQRAFDLMNAHQGIDILFGSASGQRINHYRAVHFPILRGLNGLRIALVSSDKPDVLQKVYSLSALAQLQAGQFFAWSDTSIMRANGLKVDGGSDVEGLYQMLNKGRIDYFPRSVVEILQNQAEHASLNLKIDPHILLYYPTATYFYVAADNQQLADALLCGLEHAQQDGSLNQIFARYYGEVLQQLNIGQRRVIKLHNPLLPAGVPLQRPELWYPLPATP